MNTEEYINQILSCEPDDSAFYEYCTQLVNHLHTTKEQNTDAAKAKNADLLRASADKASNIVGVGEFFKSLADYLNNLDDQAKNSLLALLENPQLGVWLHLTILSLISIYHKDLKEHYKERYSALNDMLSFDPGNIDESNVAQVFLERAIQIAQSADEAHEDDRPCWIKWSRAFYLIAIENKNSDAMFYYAQSHDSNYQTYDSNPQIAQKYYQNAADLGHAEAKERLKQDESQSTIVASLARSRNSSFHSTNSDTEFNERHSPSPNSSLA